jgi:enoyl-CoA hydratase/carnithine racemase
MDDKVLYEKDAATHIARITLNNPSKRNALQLPAMGDLLFEYMEDAAYDDDIKVLILRGVGGTWCSGADLSFAYNWYGKDGDTRRRPSQRRRLAVDRREQRWYHLFIGFPKATIVQAETYAYGAGLELALAADISIIGSDTKLGMPAARFLGPILGNLPLFFHRLGPVLAKQLLLTGDTMIASELENRGAFTKVVSPSDVRDEVERMAAKIAKMPADGIHMAKEAYRLVEMANGMALEESLSYFFHTFGTNLRLEPGEFNFVKERSIHGTSGSFAKRDEHFEGNGKET